MYFNLINDEMMIVIHSFTRTQEELREDEVTKNYFYYYKILLLYFILLKRFDYYYINCFSILGNYIILV